MSELVSGAHQGSRTPSVAVSATIASRAIWPWVGVLTGVGGLVATLFGDVHVEPDEGPTTAAVLSEVSQGAAHLSVVAGYITVALLLITAAAWRGSIERRLGESAAARVVTQGLTAAAGALALGYGWKGALAIYLPDGNEPNTFDDAGLYVYYMLNDFGSFIGWLPVVVAAGAVAWMGLKERTLPIWIGAFSVLPVLGVVLATGITGLPGFPALMAIPWMIVAFAGLGLHRNVAS